MDKEPLKMKKKITKADLFKPIQCTCAVCGGPATILPIGKNGACFCPICSTKKDKTEKEAK